MPAITLRQRQQIDLKKELLVVEAESLLEKGQVSQIDRKKFGHSQLRNVAAVAAETESPAVVANFIRFQMGRDSKEEGWSRRAGGGGGATQGERLGTLFIHELVGDGGAVTRALQSIEGTNTGSPAEQLVRMELIRHFLGFASRYLRFLDLERGGHNEEEGDAE